ncbi:hypothetical protein IKF30_00625 [Candidatus Saccharibacteria bacterium]|nr:hypothetical protein [Candidatus Saccharibacteria bacterium]
MKSKDILKEGRKPKERRVKLDIDSFIETSKGKAFDVDAKYRISYGKNFKATVTYLDGPLKNQSAIYNGKTREWSGADVPNGIKKSVEQFYS